MQQLSSWWTFFFLPLNSGTKGEWSHHPSDPSLSERAGKETGQVFWSCLGPELGEGPQASTGAPLHLPDTTEQLHFHFSRSCIGEGNGNPLQCSCLENPRDGRAWWAAVYGVAQSWTRLKRLSSSSSSHCSKGRLPLSLPSGRAEGRAGVKLKSCQQTSEYGIRPLRN